MPSQVPEDIFPLEGVTPEPAAPHAIEREASEPLNPEPWQIEPPVGAQGPEPWQIEPPVGVTNPDPWEVEPPQPAINPEPWQTEPPVSAQGPQPVEWDTQRLPAASPEPIQVEVPAPVAMPDPAEWDTGRNSAASVDPMEWVDRVQQPLQPPAVTIDIPEPFVNRELFRASRPMKIQNTYWVN